MPAIGTISAGADGRYEGYLRTFFIDAPIALIPTLKSSRKAADFQIVSQGIPIGKAWVRVHPATASNEILFLIEAPELPRPIHAFFALSQQSVQPAVFDIIWHPRSAAR